MHTQQDQLRKQRGEETEKITLRHIHSHTVFILCSGRHQYSSVFLHNKKSPAALLMLKISHIEPLNGMILYKFVC